MKNWKIIVLLVIVAVLIGSNIFFILQEQKPDYQISFGEFSMDENHTASAVILGQALKDKNDVDLVLFALLDGVSVKDPAAVKSEPYAVMMIQTAGDNAVAYPITLWVDESAVVYSVGLSDWTQYKRIPNAAQLIALMDSCLADN